MVSTIGNGGTINHLAKGTGLDSRFRLPAKPALRGDDTVTLSPESLALQDSIRQNGEAAASTLSETDTPTPDTAAGLYDLIV